MIELKLYRSFAQNTHPFHPPPPSFTQHRLIRNFQTVELMEMLKITVLVHVRRSQAEDIEWGNDLAWCGDLTQSQMATILELPLY